MLLLKLLQLERSDVNHRVGVDFALGGGPGDGRWRVRVVDGCILALPACGGRGESSQDASKLCSASNMILEQLQKYVIGLFVIKHSFLILLF